MQVIVNDLLTNYQRAGKGKVVVFLHGWAGSAKDWLRLTDSLAKSYDVIIPDLPGFGGSQQPPKAWGLNDYAAFIKNFLQKIGVKEVFAFIGHSNGGAIIIRGCTLDQFKPEKLVLLSSAGIRGQYNGRTKAVRYITKTGKFLSSPLPKPIKQKLRKKVYQTVGSDMLVAESLQETFKKIVTDDIQADAKTISIPTLLLYGENDDQTPIQYGERLHELISDSTFEILPHAGHFIQLDRFNDVEHAIKEFLK